MYIISDIYQIDILETDCFRYIQVAIDNTLGDIVEFFNDDYVDLEVCDDAD
jgi:hypothetical protein